MEKSKLTSIVLLGLSLPILFMGLIDPLEGGIALLMAGVVLTVGFWVGKTKPPTYLWASYSAALIIGVLTIVAALTFGRQQPGQGLNPTVLIGLWAYRLAVVASLLATLIYWVGLIRKWRSS